MLRSKNPNAAEEAEKFEGFIAKLLYDMHLKGVEWNVAYTREDGSRRQVDVQYQRMFSRVIIECKYRTNPHARIKLEEVRNGNQPQKRQEKEHDIKHEGWYEKVHERGYENGYEKKNLQKPINHLVDEVDERRMFARARYAVLATNAYFDMDVVDEARRQSIELWDRNTITEMLRDKHSLLGIRKLCWKHDFDLEEMIKSTKERDYKGLKGSMYRV
jgi:hypothetical protein